MSLQNNIIAHVLFYTTNKKNIQRKNDSFWPVHPYAVKICLIFIYYFIRIMKRVALLTLLRMMHYLQILLLHVD